MRGKINLEEYEDHLVFINEGAFIPETVEQALEPGYKPPYYRNAFLCNAMVNMYMIDTNSMGIPMIYEIQKGKCFPLAVLKDVLPDVLTDQQKSRKLSNLLQKMKKNGIIDVRGIAINSEWYLLTKD